MEELTTAKIEGSSDSNPTLSAGNNNYFYLPVAKDLFSDDGTAYEDLKFSVYYIRAGSRQQNTGRDYNNLTINLTAKGFYEFTVYATDSAGNEMYYYDENGVKQTYSSSDIWTKRTICRGSVSKLPITAFRSKSPKCRRRVTSAPSTLRRRSI